MVKYAKRNYSRRGDRVFQLFQVCVSCHFFFLFSRLIYTIFIHTCYTNIVNLQRSTACQIIAKCYLFVLIAITMRSGGLLIPRTTEYLPSGQYGYNNEHLDFETLEIAFNNRSNGARKKLLVIKNNSTFMTTIGNGVVFFITS